MMRRNQLQRIGVCVMATLWLACAGVGKAAGEEEALAKILGSNTKD